MLDLVIRIGIGLTWLCALAAIAIELAFRIDGCGMKHLDRKP